MGVDFGMTITGNPGVVPGANAGGPSSTQNIGENSSGEDRRSSTAPEQEGNMGEQVIDPVCRMQIDPNQAAATSDYQGQTYYFCADDCRVQFEHEPQRFVQSRRGAT